MNNADMSVYPVQPLDRQGLPEFPMEYGLTKREYFAAMAMQGILAYGFVEDGRNINASRVAEKSLIHADALLKELEK